jgi:hypothetical protein
VEGRRGKSKGRATEFCRVWEMIRIRMGVRKREAEVKMGQKGKLNEMAKLHKARDSVG